MIDKLKKYDKLLTAKKKLDGSIDVVRQSPFYSQTEYKAFTINNMFVGSGNWVINKLIGMDTTRKDLIGNMLRHNDSLRKNKSSRNMHEDIARFMRDGNSIFIN